MKINAILRTLVLCTSCTIAVAASVRTVNVQTPGSLAKTLGEENLMSTTDLKVKGRLNAADVRTLRFMAGRDSMGDKTEGQLRHLDLTDVSFVEGPEPFYGKYRVNGINVLPSTFLYNCNIESIVLPSKLDTLMAYSLSWMPIKELTIPEGILVDQMTFVKDSLMQVLRLPSMKNGIDPTSAGLTGLRSLTYGDFDYIPAQSFNNLPELEEIVFDGMVGHMDGYIVNNCPKLRRIIFRGPVATTGGAQFVKDCPELEEVVFDGLVLATGFGAPVNCPKLNGYTVNGLVLDADSAYFPISDSADITTRPDLVEQLRKLADFKARYAGPTSDNSFLTRITLSELETDLETLRSVGLTAEADKLENIGKPLAEELQKPKLQILKESPAYAVGGAEIEWTYALPTDSVLALDREYFNLDSIAGSGDDLSRIRNLTYWLHDLVRHDGGSYNPQSQSLIDIYEICKKENRGVNCRMMAIALTEALLAEGIPARYLTCQPKHWAFDSDCHVICMAWSESLGKWIWADPTFAAFPTDENGTPLNVGEVRQRLIDDLPILLNEDSNWNHESPNTKEDYIDNYMAKNLYYISARKHNGVRPEGKGSIYSDYILLAPAGATQLPGYNTLLTDPEIFWAPPAPEFRKK